MRNRLITAVSAIVIAGCAQVKAEEAEAPTVMCESHYEAPAGSGFNLLEWISVSGHSSKTRMHVNLRGDIDNGTPGNYKVMLTAYDESGNITIRNLKVTITEPEPKPEPEIPEEPEVEESPEPTPIPTSEPTPDPTPAPTQAPATAAPVQTDPYAQERASCQASYGQWMGTYCYWPTPEPTPAPAAPAEGGPHLPEGGTTTCWQEGNATVCEWVGPWIEEYDE